MLIVHLYIYTRLFRLSCYINYIGLFQLPPLRSDNIVSASSIDSFRYQLTNWKLFLYPAIVLLFLDGYLTYLPQFRQWLSPTQRPRLAARSRRPDFGHLNIETFIRPVFVPTKPNSFASRAHIDVCYSVFTLETVLHLSYRSRLQSCLRNGLTHRLLCNVM